MSWEASIPEPNEGGGGDFEIPPADNHVAVLVGLVDLGSRERTFNGESHGWSRRVALIWQLAAKKRDGSPFIVAREFTLSYHEKAALRQWLEKWRCKKYQPREKIDVGKAVGTCCLLTIEHKPSSDGQRTYANVTSIGKLPDGMPKLQPVYPTVSWQIGQKTQDGKPIPPPEDEWLPYLFGRPLADIVRDSPEFNGVPVPKSPPRKKEGNGEGPANGFAAEQAETAAALEEGAPF